MASTSEPPSLTGAAAAGAAATDPVVASNSSTRLPGDRYARADAAVDGSSRPVLFAGPLETITPWSWDWFDDDT